MVFSSSISRLLDYVREIEQQSGLTLLPALVLLTGASSFISSCRRHQQQAKAAAAELATREAEHRAEELERLVAFGQALGRALDFDSIRVAVEPAPAGARRHREVWVLVQQGSEWQALHGRHARRGAGAAMGRPRRAAAVNGPDKTPSQRSADRAIGFPLIVGGKPMGVLGVRPDRRHAGGRTGGGSSKPRRRCSPCRSRTRSCSARCAKTA